MITGLGFGLLIFVPPAARSYDCAAVADHLGRAPTRAELTAVPHAGSAQINTNADAKGALIHS